MKKLFLLVMIAFGVLGALFLPQSANEAAKETSTPKSPHQAEVLTPAGKTIEVTYNSIPYRLHLVEIPTSAKVKLIPNFAAKEAGLTIVRRENCDQAINGGFYQKNGAPLGLFLSEGTRSGTPIQSNLVTGFFYQDKSGERFISRIAPEHMDSLDIVLQTGPLAQVGSKKVNIRDDEPARRSLLVVDQKQKLYLVSVVTKDNLHSGPYLADLPSLFAEEAIQRVFTATTLLNLDGGSASFFYSKDQSGELFFSELMPIGSLFCLLR